MTDYSKYENMQDNILTKLEEIRQKFPERFSKPVHVLADVHDDDNDEWEQRLKQIKKDQIGECIVLIPYQVKDDHWIGICLKFKDSQQVEQAEFIDPLNSSEFNPAKLQKQLTKIFSNIILKAKYFQKTDDPKLSAALTVDNLLKAGEVASPSDIYSTSNETSISPESEGKSLKLSERERLVF